MILFKVPFDAFLDSFLAPKANFAVWGREGVWKLFDGRKTLNPLIFIIRLRLAEISLS